MTDHKVALATAHVTVAVADDLAVAGIEGNLAAGEIANRAKAVPLGLEDPIAIIERCVRESSEHRLQALWKLLGRESLVYRAQFQDVAEG